MEPSIYLSEEGNESRIRTPFKKGILKDEYNFASYKDVKEMNQEEVIEILKEKGYLLKFINNPTDDMIIAALNSQKHAICYVNEISEELLDKIIEKDRKINEGKNLTSAYASFPYTLVYIKNLNLDYIIKIVKETYSFYGIKINLLDRELILDTLKESGGSNMARFIKQKESFSKEDFDYIINNLLNHIVTKRRISSDRILTRVYKDKECQCDELCLSAMKINWRNYQDVKIKSKVVYLECLKYNNRYTKDLLEMGVTTEEILSINGLALKYIENPTLEQINIAVKQNGKAIEFVNDKTEELCLMAVEQDGLAIRYIKTPSFDVAVKAALNNERSIMLLDQSLRPHIRDAVKETSFKTETASIPKKDILERLEIVKKINSTILKIVNNYDSIQNDIIIKSCFKALNKVNKTINEEEVYNIIITQIKILTMELK